ncbi:MAG: hypothetical protein DLM61_22815 [Pseudonocardiales bacterium]|nr:MAG: hypothetical protein DLM61_22815 [Pseudonocardiales bacterium]
MSLSEVGVPGQRVDVLNGGDVAPDGRLLSVAEIQQAFRELRARKPSEQATPAPEPEPGGGAWHDGSAAVPGRTGDPATDAARRGEPADASPPQRAAELDARWVSVVAAHAGAGASTVALAIADAAAAAGRGTSLVETAHPSRSGLVAAANAELGLDPSGAWRRGTRGQVTIDRRAGNDTPNGWPALPASDDDLVLVDLGLPTPESLTRLAASGCRLVVVCRPTVPGVRLAEQLLNSITGPVVVACVGGGKWPGEVSASLGPRLRELRAQNATVAVPVDRRLAVTGPTNSPLPRPVATAGRSLLGLIDAVHPGGATASAQSAPRRKGTTR